MQNILDIVGIGFGPSNLALAAALYENSNKNLTALFLEKQQNFSWHKDMLLNDTEMQISFLKDIATLRNPSSSFTFLNYLKEQERLHQFINLKKFHPSRIEFNEYFKWVAKKLEHYVKYQSCVLDVIPFGTKPYKNFKIIYTDGLTKRTEFVLAKNIVIATGGIPILPAFIDISTNQRIWHSSHYLNKISNFKKNTHHPYHFCVVGGGQSASEIVYDLLINFPNAKISCVHRGFSYKPADESQFSNEIFDPKIVDLFYYGSNTIQKKILKEHSNTNYAVVDIELIEKIYRLKYEESILKKNRLDFLRFCSLISATENENEANLLIEDLNSDKKLKLAVDALILATGFRYPSPPSVLNSLLAYFQFDDNNAVKTTRNYRIVTNSEISGRLYTQGCNELTHGLSDTLLSNSPIRADDILTDILKSRAQEENFSQEVMHA